MNLDKEMFKVKVSNWLKENKVNLTGKRIRVYKYRGEWEVRIYGEPMEMPNTKKSRRKMETDENGNNSTYGIHSRTFSPFTHISLKDLESKEEKEFILEMLKT
jgi:hypothetical protein